MSKIIRKNRLLAFKEQKGRCYYCGAPMWLEKKGEFAARYQISKKLAKRLRCTAEHLIARKDGGNNNRENIAAACIYCNLTRHQALEALPPDGYRRRVMNLCLRQKWHTAEYHHML